MKEKDIDLTTEQENENVVADTDSEESLGFVYRAPARVTPEQYLSSGVTMLNLASTNHPDCFIEKGTYCLFAGESGAGKSYLATQLLAEAANSPAFDDYELVLDDCENGNLFDLVALFGKKLASRLRSPLVDDSGFPVYSASIEDFFNNVDNLLTKGKKFVYVLDSIDCLTSSVSDVRFEENKAQRQADLAKGKFTSDLSQGYGDGKAKAISTNLRRVVRRLVDTGSILIIISQLRQNITGYGPKYIRSGGMALKYYASTEIWVHNGKQFEKTIDGHKRIYGHETRVVVEKNRITGLKSTVTFPIYLGAGISDVDSMVEWLVDEGEIIRPARSNGLWEYPKFGLKLNYEQLVAEMEDNFPKYKEAVTEKWNTILSSITMTRKRRYE